VFSSRSQENQPPVKKRKTGGASSEEVTNGETANGDDSENEDVDADADAADAKDLTSIKEVVKATEEADSKTATAGDNDE
jgi:hypothetical protein